MDWPLAYIFKFESSLGENAGNRNAEVAVDGHVCK